MCSDLPLISNTSNISQQNQKFEISHLLYQLLTDFFPLINDSPFLTHSSLSHYSTTFSFSNRFSPSPYYSMTLSPDRRYDHQRK